MPCVVRKRMFVPWEIRGMWRMVAYCRMIIDHHAGAWLGGAVRCGTYVYVYYVSGPNLNVLQTFSMFSFIIL